MADPTPGPSGPSNPLFSQQSSAINTSAAEKTFADLQRVIESAAKSFSVAFESATKDTLKGQESFYKYIGDKENERKTALERYKRAAINSIEEETKAQLAAYEQRARAANASSESIAKGKIDLTAKANKQIANVEREAGARAPGPGIFGRTLQGAQNIGSRIGGPIGGMVSGVANLIAEPEIAIPAAIMAAIVEALGTRAAFTKTGMQLAGAGMHLGSGAGAGLSFAQGLFGNTTSALSRALSADQQRAIIGGMAGSSTMITQANEAATPGGMAAIRKNLGLFANILPDASKEMELFTDATKNLGMSQKDIRNTFISTRVSSHDLKITQLDAIAMQMDMQKSLRNITNDGVVAASVLGTVGGFFKSIGKNETEIPRMALGVGKAAANLSLGSIVGMEAFTTGMNPNDPKMFNAIFGAGGMLGDKGTGTLKLMGSFFSKVGAQSKNPMQQALMAEQLSDKFGLGIQKQDLPEFFNLATAMQQPGADIGALTKRFKAIEGKTPEQASADGIAALATIVNPVLQVANMFTNFWRDLDYRINQIISKIPGFGGSHINPYMPKGKMSPRDIQRYAAPADYYKNP